MDSNSVSKSKRNIIKSYFATNNAIAHKESLIKLILFLQNHLIARIYLTFSCHALKHTRSFLIDVRSGVHLHRLIRK